MNKILIIDDEILTIEYMKSLAAWKKYDCEEIISAVTVSKAKELFKRELPQIVFVDIRMPREDGLTLSKEFLQMQPNTNIVIMTAYQEFAYVKEALQMGVKGFLVKHEITEEKIEEILGKLISNISSRKNYENILWNDWLRELWDHGATEKAEICSVFGGQRRFFLLLLCFRSYTILSRKEETVKVAEKKIRMRCYPYGELRAFTKLGSYTYGVLFEYDTPASLAEQQKEIREIAERLARDCKEETQKEAVCLVTNPTNHLNELLCGLNGIKPFSNRVFVKNRTVLLEQESRKMQGVLAVEILPDKRPEAWKEKDLNACLDKLHLLDGYVSAQSLNPVWDFLRFHNLETAVLQADREKSFVCLIQLLRFCQKCLQKLEEKEQGNTIVEKAIRYIHRNYQQDLSSTIIADALNVSDGYLRTLFKKEMNYTVKEYILQFRVERSKDLLLHSNKKVYEIAKECGFSSSQHFCRVFHQITGVAPGEFKLR